MAKPGLMEKQLDLVERDPHGLNSHVKVEFEEVIAEPAGAHSFDCCWQHCFYICFDAGKGCMYKFLSSMCGCLLSVCWGCKFAWVTFIMVWLVTPGIRILNIISGCFQKCFGTCVVCYLAPLFEAYGLCFSRISVMFENVP